MMPSSFSIVATRKPCPTSEGGFQCKRPPYVVADAIKTAVVFHANPIHIPDVLATNLTATVAANAMSVNSMATLASNKTAMTHGEAQQTTPAILAKEIAFARSGLGEYLTEITLNTSKQGTFQAISNGFSNKLKYSWRIAAQQLIHSKGSVTIRGAVVEYEYDGSQIRVTVTGKEFHEFLIEVTATDGLDTLTAAKCATYEPKCTHQVPVIVEVSDYIKNYAQIFGVVRLPNAPADDIVLVQR
jgi:hypothetical protein